MRRPERRNRRIGTEDSGFKRRNKMRIPESWRDKHGSYVSGYASRLDPDLTLSLEIGENQLSILYENPLQGFGYGCSPSDVEYLLRNCQEADEPLPELILFRQPTRKQAMLEPVWGRFLYYAEVGKFSGTAIVLEAQHYGRKLYWPRKLVPDDQTEFNRLVSDGHVFGQDRRGYTSLLTDTAHRSTVLYRTLLHELGHFHHYQTDAFNPDTRLSDDVPTAIDLHWARPSAEKEAYAHRYADECYKSLHGGGLVPFDPIEMPSEEA